MKKVKEFSKTQTNKGLIDRDYNVAITRGRGGWREVDEGEGGINGDGRKLDFGWQTHNRICR